MKHFLILSSFILPAGVVLCQDTGKLTWGRHHRSSQPVQVPSHRHHIQFTRILEALWLQSRCSHEPQTQVWIVVMSHFFMEWNRQWGKPLELLRKDENHWRLLLPCHLMLLRFLIGAKWLLPLGWRGAIFTASPLGSSYWTALPKYWS